MDLPPSHTAPLFKYIISKSAETLPHNTICGKIDLVHQGNLFFELPYLVKNSHTIRHCWVKSHQDGQTYQVVRLCKVSPDR